MNFGIAVFNEVEELDLARDRAGGALCCAHARERCPGRSPGTNSPLDCSCPGSLPRRRPSATASSFTSLRKAPHRPDLAAPCSAVAGYQRVPPRPAPLGSTVTGTYSALHRGRTTMVWQTLITSGDAKLCAVVTQTQLVLAA